MNSNLKIVNAENQWNDKSVNSENHTQFKSQLSNKRQEKAKVDLNAKVETLEISQRRNLEIKDFQHKLKKTSDTKIKFEKDNCLNDTAKHNNAFHFQHRRLTAAGFSNVSNKK